jgi:poly(hydroxyalkanoate) granule-associated protein
VKESAQQIWLAGMGAFAKAQAEGKQVFDALVKEGANLQKKTQSVAEERLGEVTNKMTSMADDVTAKAGKHWDKLESIFEERTARAMKRLGVPSAKDVEALKERIEALSAQVAGGVRSNARKAAAKRGAKTPAKKGVRSAARKSAA